MKVLYIQETVSTSGSVERHSSQFDQDEVLLGRGGGSHIILSGPRLSLVHAKLFIEGDRVCVSDLNSLSGVRVNNARVSHSVLSSGDLLQLGDIKFLVNIAGDLVTLTSRITAEAQTSQADVIAIAARGLFLSSYFPRMSVLSFLAAIAVFAGCFAFPIMDTSYTSWNSGPISNAHKVIERDCTRCHAKPFEPVRDQECLSCHAMSEHAPGHKDFIAKHSRLETRCAQCHMEHNGDHGIISKDSRLCVSCHGGMKGLEPQSAVLDVPSFDAHPQFRVSVRTDEGKESRVSLDDKANLRDTTPIKLNHAVHLKAGLRGPQGAKTLECNSCHQLANDKRSMQPISFDKHCRDCHSLGFDERLPDSEVPHGNAELVYPTLFAEYAKLLLLNGGGRSATGADKARTLPGGTQLPPGATRNPDAHAVEADARQAEEELFTRTACFLCHNYTEKPASERSADGSWYSITKPHIPDVWMTKARFDHGAHEAVSCESCHEKTRTSTDTGDVLLPPVQVCRECHIQGNKPGFVKSECVQCHVYHAALEVPKDKKQSISEFLHSLTR